MRRREFLGMFASAGAWPFAARAQKASHLPTIGFLGTTTPSIGSPWIVPFVQRLRELGWIEGQTLGMETRWTEGRSDHLGEMVAELVQRKVDVIITFGSPGAVAVKQATSNIPIVFVLVADPVGIGLVPSLKQPGGNITGLSNQSSDLGPKKLELLREVLPGLRRLAVLINVGNPGSKLEMVEVQTAAHALGLDIVVCEIERAEDIAPAIDRLKSNAEALYVSGDPLFSNNRDQINSLATTARLPTMHGFREQVEAGGLMSYGTSFTDLFGRAADYVDKILRGAKPADMPVEQPVKFEFVINLRTARTLGLEITPVLLSRADEVIE
jgi:putative tryptophan/tyrosine transport system substrate-binding protein